MLGSLAFIFEGKKELIIGFSLSLLYLTYYLMEVVKKPVVVCNNAELNAVLSEEVPLLKEYYWPTAWCVEARLQTVIGSLLRSHLLPEVQYQRQVLRLRDGGQVALDWAAAPGAAHGAPVLLVLPGLTGGSDADYVRCLAAAARHLGAHVCVFNNRGQAGLPLTSPRLYCAVSHEDLREVVSAAAAARPGARLLAAGVSLGGLILGHYLAAHGERAQLAAALIVSSPIDVLQSAACMERAVNAPLSRHMARALRGTVSAHGSALPCAAAEVAAARSVRQFDAAFTAPHFGFAGVDAYYAAATLRDKLGAVRVPLLCLCAADDPFQPHHVLPWREAASWSHVALAVTARGGHIGFLEGWWPAPPAVPAARQYIARLAEQYFRALLARPALLHRAPAP